MSLFLTVFAHTQFAQEQNPADINKLKISIHMDKQPLGLVFRELMERYNVPVGFEESDLNRNHRDYIFDTNIPSTGVGKLVSGDGKASITITTERTFEGRSRLFTVNLDDASIEKVMNTIVGQMENYTWKINDGVVNIFPKSAARDKRFQELLNTRIENFAVVKGLPVATITAAIIALPEFQAFLKKENLRFTGWRAGSQLLNRSQYGRPLPDGIRLSNLTFRELLNKTTKIKGGGWILRLKPSSSSPPEQMDIDI